MGNKIKRGLLAAICFAGAIAFSTSPARAASDEARVTRVIREVNLLPSQAKPRPAVLNDKVSDGTGVRTGESSRSELTFPDLTIERLGSNTIFSFSRNGRSVRLDSGSMLLRVPKDSGGASMTTEAITVGITGTTVILETTRAGRNKFTVLEGGARVSLNKNKKESVFVHGGQMEDIPPGASKLPLPVSVNLEDIMRKNPLITDFRPLPSRDLIMNPQVYEGRSADGGQTTTGPGFLPPILPTIIGVGVGPVRGRDGGTPRGPRTKFPVKGQTGTPKNGAKPGGNKTVANNSAAANPNKQTTNRPRPKKKPTPPPGKP